MTGPIGGSAAAHPPVRPRHELLTPALLLLAPGLHLLRSHGHPLLRFEVLLVAAGVVTLGLLAGVALHRGRPALRLSILVAVIAIAWDLWFAEGTLPWAVISVGTIILLVIALRSHITTIAFAVSLALLGSTLLPPVARVESSVVTWTGAVPDTVLPPIFHFVVDEHGGLAGLAEDTALVRELSAWYGEHGFRLCPNAYSPYFDTYNSLPNLVNFTAQPVDGVQLEIAPPARPEFRDNRYFERMRERGYAIRVYQPDYMDMCGSRARSGVVSCFTYPANSVRYLADMDLRVRDRARVLVSYLLINRSWFFERSVAGYHRGLRPALAKLGIPVPRREWRGDQIHPPIGEVLGNLGRDLASGANGTLFFVHLLMPHNPYQYDARCRPLGRLEDRLDRDSPNAPEGVDNTIESRARRLELYGDQVRCLVQQMDSFLAGLDSRGILARSTIIVHGDHGTRITIRRPEGGAGVGLLTQRDLLDGFSTLFAVKSPRIEAGTDTAIAAIGDLLSQLVTTNFASVDGTAVKREPVVWIVDRPRGRMIPLGYPDPRRAQSERMLRNVIE